MTCCLGLAEHSARTEIYLLLIKISGFSQVTGGQSLHMQITEPAAPLPQKLRSSHRRSSSPWSRFADMRRPTESLVQCNTRKWGASMNFQLVLDG
jgi:hypothetical protein